MPGVNTTLVSADARFISFDVKPPPVTSWNGKLDGYILSYKNNDFGETLKRTIDNPKPEVCISALKIHCYAIYVTRCKQLFGGEYFGTKNFSTVTSLYQKCVRCQTTN